MNAKKRSFALVPLFITPLVSAETTLPTLNVEVPVISAIEAHGVTTTVTRNSPVSACYWKGESGVGKWSLTQDGIWYQDDYGHKNSKKLTGETYGAGYGCSDEKDAIEFTARFMKGGGIFSEWEHDDTYADPNADHTRTGGGWSTWKNYGISAEWIRRVHGRAHVKIGEYLFHGKWVTDHFEFDTDQELRFESRKTKFSPMLGARFDISDTAYIDITRYFRMAVPNAGVVAVTTISLGAKFGGVK